MPSHRQNESPGGATATQPAVALSPLRGCGVLIAPNQGLAPLATRCRPSGPFGCGADLSRQRGRNACFRGASAESRMGKLPVRLATSPGRSMPPTKTPTRFTPTSCGAKRRGFVGGRAFGRPRQKCDRETALSADRRHRRGDRHAVAARATQRVPVGRLLAHRGELATRRLVDVSQVPREAGHAGGVRLRGA